MNRIIKLGVFACMALLAIAGCSQQDHMTQELSSYDAVQYQTDAVSAMQSVPIHREQSENTQGDEKYTLVAANDRQLSSGNAALLNRRIIYNTSIGLVVEDYKQFESQLPAVISTSGGFVASNNTQRTYNDNQSGTWVIRVPVGQYDSFLSRITSLGFAESRRENAQDVTEEFIDVQARIKNKKALESRVLGILEDRNGKLSEVLEIERELSRVREEIERMEGRMRFLADRTSLATITLNCREQSEYIPAAAPTLGSRVTQAWAGSLSMLGSVAAAVFIGIVAIIPWLFVLACVGFAAYRLHQRFLGRRIFVARRVGSEL